MKPPVALFETLSEWGSLTPGTERVDAVLGHLGRPQARFPHILVGGTNGKGTVCATVAAALPGRVGLFLSPHIHDIRERITLAGTWLPDEAWQSAYARICREGGPTVAELSYFEWLLVLAVVLFAEQAVDFAVFEVGLGGRDDATNALDPLLSAVTNIGLDHVAQLGPTLVDIALHKVAIGRPGQPLLIPSLVADYRAVRDFLTERELSFQVFENKGTFQDNQTLAARILTELGHPVADLSLIALPGRREFHQIGKGVWIDGAHNPPAWEDAISWYEQQSGKTCCNVVATLTQGRSLEEFLYVLEKIYGQVYRFEVGYERELAPNNWPPHIRDARRVPLAQLLARPLLVCGSLYLVDPFKRWMAGWPLNP